MMGRKRVLEKCRAKEKGYRDVTEEVKGGGGADEE